MNGSSKNLVTANDDENNNKDNDNAEEGNDDDDDGDGDGFAVIRTVAALRQLMAALICSWWFLTITVKDNPAGYKHNLVNRK